MKKILTCIGLTILLNFSYAPQIKAANTCNEFYYLIDKTKVVKTELNQPNKAYQLASYSSSYIPTPVQPYLFRLNNGDFAAVFKSADATNKNNRKIFFKNITTGLETIVQNVIDRGDGNFWVVFWPRAAQLTNGDIYVVFNATNANQREACIKSQQDCLLDARVRVAYSKDQGATWKLLSELDNTLTGSPDRGGLWQPTMLELSNHTLGLLLTEQTLTPPGCARIRLDALSFYTSNNQGKTWHRRSNIYTGSCTVNNEGHIIQLSSGKLVVVFSGNEAKRGFIKQTISDDLGQTWSAPQNIADTIHKNNNIAPILQQINGKFVLLYNKAPQEREDDRILTLKIADNLTIASWDAPDYHPTLAGTGTVGANCQPPSPADLNQDGKVDIYDYNILVSDFGKTGSPGWIKADIIKDGKVDIFDYNVLVGNFGK